MSSAIYLIIYLMSYLASRKAGLSKGKAALVAGGITAGSAYFDVAGKIEGLFGSSTATPVPEGTVVPPGTNAGSIVLDKVTDWLGNNSGKLITGAVIGGGAVAADSFFTSEKGKRILIYGGAAILAYLIIK